MMLSTGKTIAAAHTKGTIVRKPGCSGSLCPHDSMPCSVTPQASIEIRQLRRNHRTPRLLPGLDAAGNELDVGIAHAFHGGTGERRAAAVLAVKNEFQASVLEIRIIGQFEFQQTAGNIQRSGQVSGMKFVRLAHIDQQVSLPDRLVALLQRCFVNPGFGFRYKIMNCFHVYNSVVFSINVGVTTRDKLPSLVGLKSARYNGATCCHIQTRKVLLMIFRQLFDSTSSTYTYLLADENAREALLIDPVFAQVQRDLALVDELGLELRLVIDTHAHADHVTAAWLLRAETGCDIASARAIGAENVTVPLDDGQACGVAGVELRCIATPGHTDGCMSFVTADESRVFTGDTLLIRGCGRSDFQQGSANRLYESITGRLFALPESCQVYPAHDYQGRNVSSIGEEKRFNARVGAGASETDFVEYMNAMKLPHPKLIDEAVPANMRSGAPEQGNLPDRPDWGDIHLTYSGCAGNRRGVARAACG